MLLCTEHLAMGLLRKLLTLSGTAFVAYNVGYSAGLDTGRSARAGRSMAEQVQSVKPTPPGLLRAAHNTCCHKSHGIGLSPRVSYI